MIKSVSKRSATSRSKKRKPRPRNVAARQTARKAPEGKLKKQSRIDALVGKLQAGSKQAGVIAMLRAPAGATIAGIAGATGWQPHSVRDSSRALFVKSSASTSSLKRVTPAAFTGLKVTAPRQFTSLVTAARRNSDARIKSPQA